MTTRINYNQGQVSASFSRMNLFTVTGQTTLAGKTTKHPPRYDLRPMNHAAACNFAKACTTEFTSYELHPWPADVPAPGPPLLANGYRK